jgi:lipoyl-dependent peroxiredoxin
MPIRTSEAIWEGTLSEGTGVMKVGSEDFEVIYSRVSRFEDAPGSNPEELIGAAHAGCFSMFLASVLTKAGFTPTRIHTIAKVHLERDDIGPKITTIELSTTAQVPGLDDVTFRKSLQTAKENCPVSRALSSVNIVLHAELENS